MKKRSFYVFIGSKAFFDRELRCLNMFDNANSFLEIVKLSDNAKESGNPFFHHATSLVVRNNEYLGIVASANDRVGPLIEELTTEDAHICIHNPPRVLLEYLKEKESRNLIEINIEKEVYEIEKTEEEFAHKVTAIYSHILGQNEAIDCICKRLWYLTLVKRQRPYVIMLYGNSGLGKTELIRIIAQQFFCGKLLEKHLSMFKNNNYSEYFFGEDPNRRSLGFDLLERESNLVFFDEIDKCPEHFFSAFYTLFDNVMFKDATYDVDISGMLIMLTSNYKSEEEIKRQLGEPIFCRIDKFIRFNDFSKETIHQLVRKELEDRSEEYSDRISLEEVYAIVSHNILLSGENARTIKFKVQQVIENLLFDEIKESVRKSL